MKRFTTLLLVAVGTLTAQAQTGCGLPHDINNNGSVDIEDFLSILGLFGDQDSDGDGVYDSIDTCFDLESCNYLEVDAEFCLYPDAVGDCDGDCPADANGDGICDVFSCGAPVSYQGYDYATVSIGDQCWLAENLRSEHYRNGDPIPGGLSAYELGNTNQGAQTFLENNEAQLTAFGRMYNWYAVIDDRALCPAGWHVPSDGEFMTLEMTLGMSSADANSIYARGTTQGTQLKASASDSPAWNGSNSSGFSALPGGESTDNGSFLNDGVVGWFWTSTPASASGWYRSVDSYNPTVYRNSLSSPNYYVHVRCLQD